MNDSIKQLRTGYYIIIVSLYLLVNFVGISANAVKVGCAVLLWISLIHLYSNNCFKFPQLNKEGRFFVWIYLIYTAFMVVKSLVYDDNSHFTGDFFFTIFGSLQFGVFVYVIPLFFCFSRKEFIYPILKSFKWVTVIFVIALMLNFDSVIKDHSLNAFSLAYASILMCPFLPYIKRRILLILLLILLTCVFYFVDERAAFLYAMICIVGTICIKHLGNNKTMLFTGSLLVITISVAVLIYSLYYGISIFEIAQTIYSDKSDLVHDTRSFIFFELSEDLTRNNLWLFGKGLLGTCYSPYFDQSVSGEGDSAYRIGLEVGFLQYILKGGLAYLILYMATMLLAIRNAFFESNSHFVKIIGILVLANFLMSCVSQGPGINMRYFMFWVLMGMCFSKDILSLSDNEIYSILNQKKNQ